MTAATDGVVVDAEAFVAEAERLTNTYDVAGAAAVYAADASLELVTDGAVQWHRGRSAISDAWAIVLGAGQRAGFVVEKEVVAASERTIVNRWTGSFRHGGRCRGVESWVLDADGLVVEHRAETFLDVRPGASFRGRLAVLLASPRVALQLGRVERQVRRRGA